MKDDPQGETQYGLIAEEVYNVFPELVIRDASGKIQGVRYDKLAPMLVQQVQHQHDQLAAQSSEISDLKQQVSSLRQLARTMQTALAEVQGSSQKRD